MAATAQVLYFDAPGQIAVRAENLPQPRRGEVQVKTLCSAISPGTEMLFFRGLVPQSMSIDSTLPGMDQPMTYPLRYGYACVGQVVAVSSADHDGWLGRRVFAFQPHASHFNARPEHLSPLPDDVDAEAAALFPNLETAVSLVHDSAPLVGERVLIFGQGIVGLLTTWLLSTFHLERLATVDPLAFRRSLSQRLGAHTTFPPHDLEGLAAQNPDLILELSGNPAALRTAIEIAGFHARIIVGSWYGIKPAELPLGHDFHRNRIVIYSSQVSTIPPALSARWDKARRSATVWRLLARLPYEDLITQRIPIAHAQTAYDMIARAPETTCQVLLTYTD